MEIFWFSWNLRIFSFKTRRFRCNHGAIFVRLIGILHTRFMLWKDKSVSAVEDFGFIWGSSTNNNKSHSYLYFLLHCSKYFILFSLLSVLKRLKWRLLNSIQNNCSLLYRLFSLSFVFSTLYVSNMHCFVVASNISTVVQHK